jgi:hypothetical protein
VLGGGGGKVCWRGVQRQSMRSYTGRYTPLCPSHEGKGRQGEGSEIYPLATGDQGIRIPDWFAAGMEAAIDPPIIGFHDEVDAVTGPGIELVGIPLPYDDMLGRAIGRGSRGRVTLALGKGEQGKGDGAAHHLPLPNASHSNRKWRSSWRIAIGG